MASASDAMKSRHEIVEEATKDMTGFEKVIDVTSAGSMTNKYLNRNYINLTGDLQNAQAYVQNMTYQITDDQYKDLLDEIAKDTQNAIGKSDAIFNTMGGAFTALNVIGAVGAIRNFAGAGMKLGTEKIVTKTLGKTTEQTVLTATYNGASKAVSEAGTELGTVVGKQTAFNTLKSIVGKVGGVGDGARGILTRIGGVAGGVAGGAVGTVGGVALKAGGYVGLRSGGAVGAYLVGNMAPLLATYGLTSAINKGIKNDILTKTEDTMIMIASVKQGIADWENDDLHTHFDNMTKSYSDGLHGLSDALDAGQISEEEYNQRVSELNDQYQGDLSEMIDGLSPEDQNRLQQWLTTAAAKDGIDINAQDIKDLDMAGMYAMYGSASQQMGQDNPATALASEGRDPSKYYEDGQVLDDVSDECKEANAAVLDAMGKYKYGLANSEFGAFVKTLNARIVNACPVFASVEAAMMKAVDFIVDKVADLLTNGQHQAQYEGMSISDIADNIKLNSAKHIALADGYRSMIGDISAGEGNSWMPKDYSNVAATNEYLDSIAEANSIAEVNAIVDSGKNVTTVTYGDVAQTETTQTENTQVENTQAENAQINDTARQTEIAQNEAAMNEGDQVVNDAAEGNAYQVNAHANEVDECNTGDYAPAFP